MTDAVLVGAIASAVVQALKRTGLASDLYGVVLIVVGALAGAALAYASGDGTMGDGAVAGIIAALTAAGIYSTAKVAGRDRPARDERGRFVAREDEG